MLTWLMQDTRELKEMTMFQWRRSDRGKVEKVARGIQPEKLNLHSLCCPQTLIEVDYDYLSIHERALYTFLFSGNFTRPDF